MKPFGTLWTRWGLLLVLASGLWSTAASALSPHEVILLVNHASEASVLVAREYAAGRGIPERNRIDLNVPGRFLTSAVAMPADEFTRLIWDPVQKILAERGLEDQILAWIYSVDFPLRIQGDPPLSLTGLTFLRNRIPNADEAREGRYASPLYAGPDPEGGRVRPPSSLDRQLAVIGRDDMPLPAALLGYTGPGGNSVETVLRALRDGLKADATRPRGTVYFVIQPDIRSRIRQWQFEPAVRELALLDIHAVVTEDFPEGKDVLGLLSGTQDPDPSLVGGFVPGAFAENLTSFSAVYQIPEHTKMTTWIEAGASASAGVVTEPRAYWTKFPAARFFVYYAAGCALIESFYQSVRCPLQSVLIGDPLMRPFGQAHQIVFETRSAERHAPIEARVIAPRPAEYARYEFWLNDQLLTNGVGRIRLDPVAAKIPPGTHRLRVVARRLGNVRQPLWAETEIVIPATDTP